MKKLFTLQNLFSGLLILFAAMTSISVFHREFFAAPSVQAMPSALFVSDWRQLSKERSPILGSVKSPVQIVIFSDYQCPYCRELNQSLIPEVEADKNVALYKYDLPLEKIHPFAMKAAIAARCALAQGVGIGYENDIYDHNKDLSKFDWSEEAVKNGLPNPSEFKICETSNPYKSEIASDIEMAQSLNINATPTMIINGSRIDGAQTASGLRALIGEATKQ